jgi:uncharacterized membrane protein YbhN (UPF0104 family)
VFILLVLAGGLSQVVAFQPAVRTGVLVFAAVAAAALITVWYAAARFASLVRRTVGVLSPNTANAIASLVDTVSDGVRMSARSGQLWRIAGWSFSVWLLSGVAIILTIRALHVPVPWVAGLFVLMVINLGGAIPASPGSIGVYHYLYVLALSVWVADPSAALGAALITHALGVVVTLTLGIVGLARQGISVGRIASMFRPVPLTAK